MKAQRKTVQKVLVQEALNSLYHPTADEVYDYVHEKHSTVSRATLYRNLKTMSEKGNILKIDSPGIGAARYDDVVRPHFHGKCRVCGKIFDIEMEQEHANSLRKKVRDSYGFKIENQEVVFIGVCPNCSGGK